MDTRISQWAEDLTRATESGYSRMALEFVLLFMAVLIATTGVAILGTNLAKAGKKYIFISTSENKLHYVWMVSIIVLAVTGDVYASAVGAFVIFSMLLSGIGAIIFLIKWSKKGLYLSIAYVWIVLVVSKLPSLYGIIQDCSRVSEYDAPNQFVLYQIDRMTSLNIIARSVIAGCITIFLVVYYGKRYLLFTENRVELSGVNACPSCGRPVTSLFCPNCGRDLKSYKKSILSFTALDKDKFCVKCGARLLSDGRCPRCVSEEFERLSIKEVIIKTSTGKFKEILISTISDKTKAVLFIIFLMFLLVYPNMYPSALSKMLSGSTVIYNSYIEKVVDYRDNPTVSYDEGWMREFDEAYNALFAKNASGFYEANPAALTTFDNHAYALYFPYCYYQNQIIGRINLIVAMHNSEELPQLLNELDETTDMQQQILLSELNRVKNANQIQTAKEMVIDSVRFYIVLIGTPLFVIALVACGIASVIGGIFILKRNRFKKLFIAKENDMIRDPSAYLEGKRYRKEQKREWIMAIVLLIVIGLISFSVNTLFSSHEETGNYEAAAQSAYFESGMVMYEWLCTARKNPDMAQKDTENFLAAVENWNRMREVMTLPENQEEANSNKELSELNLLIDAELVELKRTLLDGTIPDNKLLTETARNIAKGMNIIQPSAYKQLEESLKEELSD